MSNALKRISVSRRKWLEAQGFIGYSDEELQSFSFGIRFTYLMSGILMLLGLVLPVHTHLSAALNIAFFAIILPNHPFDYLYNEVVRHWIGKAPIPPRPNQMRFACVLTSIWMAGIICLLYSGMTTAGYVFGGMLVVKAAFVASTDICFPSMIYNLLFEKKEKSDKIAV